MFLKVKSAVLIACTSLFSMVTTQAHAQKSLFLMGGIAFTGQPYNYKFQQEGRVLNKNWALNDGRTVSGVGTNLSLALHKRLTNSFAIETGLEFSEMDLIVNDKHFMNQIGIKGSDPIDNTSGTVTSLGNFDAANWYRCHYISCYYFLPSRSRANLYFSGGLSLNYLTGPLNMTGYYNYAPTNETLQLTTHYKPLYLSSFLESGICLNSDRSLSGHRLIYVFGLRYYFAQHLLTGDYVDKQNGNTVSTDHVDSSGSYLAVTLRVGGALVHSPGRAPIAFHKRQHPKNHHPMRAKGHKTTRARRSPKRQHPQPAGGDRSNTLGW